MRKTVERNLLSAVLERHGGSHEKKVNGRLLSLTPSLLLAYFMQPVYRGSSSKETKREEIDQ